MNARRKQTQPAGWRHVLVMALFACVALALVWRTFDLQVGQHAFLKGQGDARQVRTLPIPAHRGMILDRNGEVLAVSAPVKSVWVNPAELLSDAAALERLASVLELDAGGLRQRVEARQEREFVYVRRHIQPSLAEQVRNLGLPGVYLQREYRRYYPSGEVSAHLLGLTDIDDRGQEGLELAYDEWLSGEPGAKRVIRDRKGGIIEDVEQIEAARPGKDLMLSIDRRLQYLAYRELKQAVQLTGAQGGAAVMLDARTGEVLAMVNQPGFNPNNRAAIKPGSTRNRAVTDTFEPGSTMKPFTIAAALASGSFSASDTIHTAPGYVRVGGFTIKDHRNYGDLDLTGIIRKSSNVGATKIALEMGPEPLWQLYESLGVGQPTGIGFPGETSGLLRHFSSWRKSEIATHAYGYGMSVTLLQLARAYSVLAADGVARPVSLMRVYEPEAGTRVIPAEHARRVRHMMHEVVRPGGTATTAALDGYRVAGKTGTVHKLGEGGYSEDSYRALFAGMAPLDNPRLVLVVMIDDPRTEEYSGGKVAAPVFARIMQSALRLWNVAPDDRETLRAALPKPGAAL